MRIKSCELIRCKRLELNSIDRFVIRPKQLVQLILGTNGSGKSSLMKLLTPLPPDPNDFYKDGSKFIEIEDRGNDYALKSTFDPKAHHSFIKNGEEMNLGGTIGAFKELCRQEFNMTTEVHDLLMSREIFTDMGPTKRREWFTRLCDINYDYALSVFKKLKDRSRDTTGALRTAKKRLVAESTKIMTAAEEEKLRGEVDETMKELRLLISQSAPLDRPVSDYSTAQQRGLDELHRLSQRLIRLKVAAPYGATDPYSIDPRVTPVRDEWHQLLLPVFKSINDIDSYIDELRHQATAKETLINKAVQEHGKLTETVEILLRTGQEGAKSLKERLEGERKLRDDALRMRKLGIEGINARNAIGALESVHDVLTEVFNSIPSNEDKRFSRVRLQEMQDQHAQLKNTRTQKHIALNDQVARKAHMESHKATGPTECPQCHHKWHAGYDEKRLQEISNNIDTINLDITKLDHQLTEVEEEIVKIQEYSNMYRDYMNCVRNWPVLQPFWDHLNENNYVIESPRKALSVLNIFRTDLEFERQAAKHEDDAFETIKLIESAEKIGDADLNVSKQKLDDCTLQIDTMTAEMTDLQNKIGNYLRYRGQVLESENLARKIQELMMSLESGNAELIEMMRRETLTHCINRLQSVLAIKQETLNAAIIQRSLIVDLENQIKKLTIEEEAASLMVRELSPTDGLIAEGLFGFIRKFTNQMNALIRKIWSYPMRVMDCGVAGQAGAELDYKFPLMVSKESNVVPDIKDASSGQQEIINLAFKVTAMMYLGLQESPLYLDEFASAFDDAHRTQAMAAIKSMMDQKPFTQLFMVSHYESCYGSFTNSEVCVLDTRNIAVPGKYNEHVTIE